MDSFKDKYAHYYDILYQDKNYIDESNYIHKILTHYRPNTKDLFEMGCGTGRHSKELCRYGYKIHGIDNSNTMLNDARKSLVENLSCNIEYHLGDIRTYRCCDKFDAAISLFHVISYQTSNDDLLNSIETAAFHIKEGGVFIFDCWYGPAVLTIKPEERTKEVTECGVRIIRKANPTILPNDNIVEVQYNIDIINENSSEAFTETHRMRYFFSPEIKLALNMSGFDLIDSFEFGTGKALSTNTWNACYVAVKK